MCIWTIGYIIDGDKSKPRYIEVFSTSPFEAYRNGWEVSAIIEKLPHKRISLTVIHAGDIDSNKKRYKIEEEFVIKRIEEKSQWKN